MKLLAVRFAFAIHGRACLRFLSPVASLTLLCCGIRCRRVR